MSLDVNALPRLEELLTEEEFLQLRYLACHLVQEHISNDYGIIAYILVRVLRNWGYNQIFIAPAIKRIRTVATTEDANNFFNPKYTDDTGDQPVKAEVALVVVQPCKIVDDDNPDQKPLLYGAITDLFQPPELDVPIYCMMKRNTLSPLATVPEIKVAHYVLMSSEQDPVCKEYRERMTKEERARIDDLQAMFSGPEPGERYFLRLPEDIKVKVRRVIERFTKTPEGFGPHTRPGEGFFRFFQFAMERVKMMGDFDPKTNTLTIKRHVKE